ncbi:MAG TPA: hypothetical protein VHX38_14895 [Pseudonocardiaceae bacterium]|jgi:hypothetical protein|nr:hypothetical protein [Pseudonocardiaceae bacterium]
MSAYSPAEQALLTRLAELFDRLDPVPTEVGRAAEHAVRVLRPTAEVRRLELVRDSAIRPLTVAMRGPGTRRRMSFGVGRHLVDVELESLADGTLALTGLLADQEAARVWVRWPTGAGWGAVDEVGRFALDAVPAGPLCLLVARGGELGLTSWFVG